MGRYVQQAGMTMPDSGSNIIHHFVKTFSNADSALLDTEINLWFLSLEGLTSSPIIQSVDYSTVVSPSPMSALLYTALVHFILVE